jgi:hypothetical protein
MKRMPFSSAQRSHCSGPGMGVVKKSETTNLETKFLDVPRVIFNRCEG